MNQDPDRATEHYMLILELARLGDWLQVVREVVEEIEAEFRRVLEEVPRHDPAERPARSG
jgi:hypothetical protein